MAKKLQKEQELNYPETIIAPEKKERSKSVRSSVEIRTNGLPKSSNILPDSEWVKLSPQEKLSWAKSTQDPRIAIGHQSPLEKKIVSLGGLHTPAARNLLVQRYKEEHETLSKEKAMSFDYRLAKAENYYYTRIMEMMEEQNEFKKPQIEPVKIPKSQKSSKIKEWDYLVPKRELKHIKSHILRTEQARYSKDIKYKSLPQSSSKTHFPLILFSENKKNDIKKTPSMRKHIRESDQKQQMKEHLERMNRGREFSEERIKERLSIRIPSHPPPFQKQMKKKSRKTFEWSIAYPLLQPQDTSPIKVDVLMEESSEKKDVGKIKQISRPFLTIPSLLRSHLEKMKHY
ncbi:putative uncharacterized protein ZNRD1-AS1 isoform X2 [Antechinus flavipes]|nr:putative uncharacterized protein ZNRD1-AS1 isoform X2 [Antechinus flavipes]